MEAQISVMDAHEATATLRTGVDYVKYRMDHLEAAYVQKQGAAEAYRNLLKAVADESEMDTSAINAVVAARCRGDADKKAKITEQQMELFEAM